MSHSAQRGGAASILHAEEENVSALLYDFDPSQGSEMNQRPPNKPITMTALTLLTQFGDSVSIRQEDILAGCA